MEEYLNYMGYFQKGLSFEQNVDKMLFDNRPRLKDEFNRLFAAIFNNPEDSKKVVRLLATRHSGFTREEITKPQVSLWEEVYLTPLQLWLKVISSQAIRHTGCPKVQHTIN